MTIIWILIGTLPVLAVGGWLGWNAADRDTGAEGRVKVLEAELERERELRADGRAMYLDRLARCRGCATCNPEPESFTDMPDYEPGDVQ